MLFKLVQVKIIGSNEQNNNNSENTDVTGSTPDNVDTANNTDSNSQSPKETVLAEFSTKILDKEKNRLNNIKITCNKLNNTIVNAGTTFSFCDRIGPSKESDGYKQADALDSNGKKFKTLGGGKCQVSSTLYATVLLIPNITVTERHEHSKKVPYIEKGKDATVAYDYLDLKFVNNTGHQIKIYCSTDNSHVSVKIVSLT